MGKKYELTDETIEYKGRTLYRIRSLKKFLHVGKGDLGGFVESEDNLEQTGACWLSGNAKAYDKARVMDNAVLYDNAEAFGKAVVRESACLTHDAKAYGNSLVTGNATLHNKARVYGNSCVGERSTLWGNSRVFGDATVLNSAIIGGSAKVKAVVIDEPVYIVDRAIITNRNDYIVCGPLGARQALLTAYLSEGSIYIGAPFQSSTLELNEAFMGSGGYCDDSPALKLFFQMARARFGK